MVEVFKTNVSHWHEANMLIDEIQKLFVDYVVNFDLDDCDKILRVKCTTRQINSAGLIDLIKEFGFVAEILSDEPFRAIDLSTALLRSNQLN